MTLLIYSMRSDVDHYKLLPPYNPVSSHPHTDDLGQG